MNNVVIEGLKSILSRINLSTGFVHPNDKGCTIELLRKLKSSGYLLDPIAIRNWVAQNGLDTKYADDLKEFVVGVNSDRRYQIGKTPYWNDSIIEVLKNRAD